MGANSLDQWRSLHASHHQYPISNESNPGKIFGLCGLISGCVKRTVKRFSFVFFIHHYKTVIKTDQTSSFYLLYLFHCYIVLKISKVGKCHRDNVISSEATKTYRPKARISHFKNTSGQQFSTHISGLHKFGRKRLLRFSTMHFSVYESIYPRLNLQIVADKPLLYLDVYIQLLGWIVSIKYSTHDCVWPVRLFFNRVNASSSVV